MINFKQYNKFTIFCLLLTYLLIVYSFFIIDITDLTIGKLLYLFIYHSILLMNFSIGIHRYFSHKAFKTSKFMEYIFVILGSSFMLGSIKDWVSEHHSHHKHTDDIKLDPHSTKKGFWYSYVGWLFYKSNFKMPRYLNNDTLELQHKHVSLFTLFFSVFIPGLIYYLLFGSLLESFFIGVIWRSFLIQNNLFLLTSFAHIFGQKDKENKESATNSTLLAILSFGEGYHLNHHKYPSDYRCGIKSLDFDPGKWLLFILNKIGVVWNLNRIFDNKNHL